MAVKYLSLKTGEDLSLVLPPGEECPQVDLLQAARQDLAGDHCLVGRVESLDTDHITREEHLVSENRLRLILRDSVSGEKFYCWLFGEYSDAFVSRRMRPSDLLVLTKPSVSKTRLKYKQVLPPDMSCWTVYCLTRDKKPLTLVKVEDDTAAGGKTPAAADDPAESAISDLIDAINMSDTEFSMEQAARSSHRVNNENISPNIPGPAQAKNSRQALGLPQSSRPKYSFLSNCKVHKNKYNVWAVVTEVLETPMRRKSKIVAKIQLTDESLSVAGDLRENFKFDILTDSFEQMPELVVGSVMRIHHMTVEEFNGRRDGRVYSGHCVTVVEGDPGQVIAPRSTATRAGKDLVWEEEDRVRVEQLRDFWAGTRVVERSLEDIKDSCVSSVFCRLVSVTRVDGMMIIRVEDGSVSRLVTVEFLGPDTNTLEQLGDNKMWVDIWVESRAARIDVERLMLGKGDVVKLERLSCALLEDEDRHRSFRFSIESGSIQKLNPNEDIAKSLMARLSDSQSQTQDSYLDKILKSPTMDTSFVVPTNPSEVQESQELTKKNDPTAATSTQDQEVGESEMIPSASLPSPVLVDPSQPSHSPPSHQEEEVSLPNPPLAQPPHTEATTASSEVSAALSPSVNISGFTQPPSNPGSLNRTPPASPPLRNSRRTSLRSSKLNDGSKSQQKRVTKRKKSQSLHSSSPRPTTRSALRRSLESSDKNPEADVLRESPDSVVSNDEPDDKQSRVDTSKSLLSPESAAPAPSEVSVNLLAVSEPPGPAESSEAEPWSQMSQFPADRSPVRTRSVSPEKTQPPAESPVSKVVPVSRKERSNNVSQVQTQKQKEENTSSESQSSSQTSTETFFSCQETLSEHNYSRPIDIDDLLDTYTDLEEDEDNAPVDSMEVNVDENETLTNNTTVVENPVVEAEKVTKDDVPGSVNDSKDMFSSKESEEEDMELETETSNDVTNYRSKLIVSCEPAASDLLRKDCKALLTAEPGQCSFESRNNWGLFLLFNTLKGFNIP